jgi:nicotinamide mononucleotide adenylyltransferase
LHGNTVLYKKLHLPSYTNQPMIYALFERTKPKLYQNPAFDTKQPQYQTQNSKKLKKESKNKSS